MPTEQQEALAFAFRHTELAKYIPEPSKQEHESLITPDMPNTWCVPSSFTHESTSAKRSWNIILPICSKGQDNEEEVWSGLEAFAASVISTTSDAERKHLIFAVGVDEGDRVYDCPAARIRIRELLPGPVRFEMFPEALAGNICDMWNRLAQTCRTADFFVLLGDDVTLLDPGWKTRIEDRFVAVAASTGLPFGDACIAFHDASENLPPGFSTFPVVHRRHLERFGQIVPDNFLVRSLTLTHCLSFR